MVGTTLELAGFVCETGPDALPEAVRHAGRRAFLNFLGCAFGGASEEAVGIAAALADAMSGPRTATAARPARRDGRELPERHGAGL